MRTLIAGARIEFLLTRATPDTLIPLVIGPLFTIIFLMIVRHAGRTDLEPDALLAPVLMTLWTFALFQGGSMVTGDRWQGLLEAMVATPASLGVLMLGRIAAIMTLGLVGFLEVWGIGKVAFGVSVHVYHPLALALTLLATVFATAGTTIVFAAMFVLARNSDTFANSASFPFYVLGGVFAPVSALPVWLRPFSALVFMSWSADLLRASLRPQPMEGMWWRLGVVVMLGAVGFGLGNFLLALVLRRVRDTGDLSTA